MSQLDWPAEDAAAERGQVVRRPGPRELLVDVDSEDARETAERAIDAYGRLVEPATITSSTPSRTPGHYHLIVTLERDVVDDRERVSLEAVLGGDPVRAVLCLSRIERGITPVSVFFENADPCTAEADRVQEAPPCEPF